MRPTMTLLLFVALAGCSNTASPPQTNPTRYQLVVLPTIEVVNAPALLRWLRVDTTTGQMTLCSVRIDSNDFSCSPDNTKATVVVPEDIQRLIDKYPSKGTPSTQLPLRNAKGWVLYQDAKGNKAYVGPNKEIEEVK